MRLARRRGFTAVELLAATALTAVLMVTVLHVIGAIGRGRAAMRRLDAGEPLRSEVLESLRWDLTNAKAATFTPAGLTLTGHAALDRDTLDPRHRPVTVAYEVARVAGRPWLVRRQSPSDAAQADGTWTELLCPDVASFVVEPVSRGGRSTWGRGSDDAPSRVRVRMEAAGGVTMDEELVLR